MGRFADHQHEYDHGREGGSHTRASGVAGRFSHLAPHSHDVADKVDTALETSNEGMRALKISFVALGATAIAQAAVVALTGSVALLSDTLHNVGDALTAVPLAIAFAIGRRPPSRRFTYGYGRSEDLAGIVIVLTIAASAALAGYESVHGLLDPPDLDYLGAVAGAGFIGFAGNELVARYRIRVGRRIGSAALVADGLHARTDGFTSLAVVLGAIGVAAGFPQADPLVGLVITLAILVVLGSAAREVLGRLMDAVDPELVDRVRHVLGHVTGVERVGSIRLRWIGHSLQAEANLVVDQDLTVADGHAIAEAARHALLQQVPRLVEATIHTDPCGHDGTDPHDAPGWSVTS